MNIFEEQARLEQLARRIAQETRERLLPYTDEAERRYQDERLRRENDEGRGE